MYYSRKGSSLYTIIRRRAAAHAAKQQTPTKKARKDRTNLR